MKPPFWYQNFHSIDLGEDETNPYCEKVTIETCKTCGKKWLHYLVENPFFSRSGRWYRGLITEQVAQSIRPESAVSLLESLEWYFRGGSFYNSTGERSCGTIHSS
jgi:hypothetical protein